MSDNENSLVDDGEDLGNLGGLSFSDDRQRLTNNYDSEPEVPILSTSELPRSPKARTAQMHFDIIDAKIINEKKSKYVMYMILVKTSSLDLSPLSVERRYSHFDRLHSQLRKAFPETMTNIVFPRKHLTGNLKPAVIAQRSRGFEQYLSHVGSLPELLFSSHFKEFFYGEANGQAVRCFREKLFTEAVPHIRTVLRLQKKLYGDLYEDTVTSLAALTVCFMQVEGGEDKAQTCSDAAIRCLSHADDSPLLVPLLQLTIHLCWKLGREKQDLERQLQRVGQFGREHFTVDGLWELVLCQWRS